MKEIELQPCPFCGEAAFCWRMRDGYKISCKADCVTMPPRHDMAFNTREHAAAHWNERAELAKKDERIRELESELSLNASMEE